MKVCIGGTFSILHKGHKILIGKAFELAGEKGSVFIGLSSGHLLKNKKITETFKKRKEKLKQYLLKKGFLDNTIIKPITDKYGPSIDGDFDAIVVSPETKITAKEINEKRKVRGKTPLKIIQIPFVMADDNLPISSTRVNNKEIDENGKVLKRD
jgi:pantetheine-phosphate adenylyltransferase